MTSSGPGLLLLQPSLDDHAAFQKAMAALQGAIVCLQPELGGIPADLRRNTRVAYPAMLSEDRILEQGHPQVAAGLVCGANRAASIWLVPRKETP